MKVCEASVTDDDPGVTQSNQSNFQVAGVTDVLLPRVSRHVNELHSPIRVQFVITAELHDVSGTDPSAAGSSSLFGSNGPVL